MTSSGLQPFRCTSCAEIIVVSATTAPTDRSMPPVRITNVMPDRDDAQEGVVDEQVQEHLRREEAVVEHRARGRHRDEQRDGDAERNEAPVDRSALAAAERVCAAGHATCSRAALGRLERQPSHSAAELRRLQQHHGEHQHAP